MPPSRYTVSFVDSDRILHEVEVWATSVYGAVGQAMQEFRTGGLNREVPRPHTEIAVAVHRQPVTHKLKLDQVRRWVDGNGRSPQDAIERNHVKRLLGAENK